MIKLLAFLGNYGAEYKNTRHNAGFICADNLPLTSTVQWQKKFSGEYCQIKNHYSGTAVHCIKPLTYMNNSGASIIQVVKFFKLKPEELLVIHDELELPNATISLKWSGGLGGHNGLRSIKAHLGTADFWRLRIGIGRPKNDNADIADYVLSGFSKSEEESLNFQLPKITELVDCCLKAGSQDELLSLLPQWSKVVP